MTRYRIVHRTTYAYDATVSSSYGRTHLRPRDLSWQRCESHDVRVDPVPGDTSEGLDAYGNHDGYFHVTTAHDRLDVVATSVVDVRHQQVDDAAGAQPWERCRPRREDLQALDHVRASPRVDLDPAARAYAARSLTPGRPLLEAAWDLSHRIHTDFRYDKTATTVTSRVADVVAAGGGVCQDFAHLMLAGLRSHGLAARYVSGYLATTPRPGRERVVGAGATHAWVAVWVPAPDADALDPATTADPGAAPRPRGTWWHVDPTNDCTADDRYPVLAWGRDYQDVTPVRGVIFTDGRGSRLSVSVDVAPLPPDGPDPQEAPPAGPAAVAPAAADPAGGDPAAEEPAPDDPARGR